eukprot:scaffold11072_cov101-Isochrysis_galbana.AAC.2
MPRSWKLPWSIGGAIPRAGRVSIRPVGIHASGNAASVRAGRGGRGPISVWSRAAQVCQAVAALQPGRCWLGASEAGT